MALAFERMLMPAIRQPDNPIDEHAETELDITVVFTSADETTFALRRAAALAMRLSAHITLVVPQIVPYPLPLSSPPVLLDFNERRLGAIAAACPVETTVQLYLCRDPRETLCSVLRKRSVIVIGGRRRWWPTREKRLARMLRRAGHEVLLEEAG